MAGEEGKGKKERFAWEIPTTGSVENLRRVASPMPTAKEGEVLVAVRAIGLNFADVFSCLGLYSATPPTPFVPGLEFAGTVAACGTGVKDFAVGDRVMGCTRFGAYTTHLVAHTRLLRKLPEGWSFAQGSALLAQGLTALYALEELGNIHGKALFARKSGKRVLVHSAAGGVGLLAVHMLQHWGAKVVATVGSEGKIETLTKLTKLKREHIIVRTTPHDFPAQLRACLDALADGDEPQSSLVAIDGFDVVLDSIAGGYLQPGLDALNPGGRLIVFGSASLTPKGDLGMGNVRNWASLAYGYATRPRIDPVNLISQNKSVCAFNLIWLWECVERLGDLTDQLVALCSALPPPHVGHTFGFDDVHAALKFFQSGASVGKVVVEIPEGYVPA